MNIMHYQNFINGQKTFATTYDAVRYGSCLPLVNNISMQCCLHFPHRLNKFLIVSFYLLSSNSAFFSFVGIFIGSIHLFPTKWSVLKWETKSNCMKTFSIMKWFSCIGSKIRINSREKKKSLKRLYWPLWVLLEYWIPNTKQFSSFLLFIIKYISNGNKRRKTKAINVAIAMTRRKYARLNRWSRSRCQCWCSAEYIVGLYNFSDRRLCEPCRRPHGNDFFFKFWCSVRCLW